MQLDAPLFGAATAAEPYLCGRLAPLLNRLAPTHQLDTPARMAAFLANAAHESECFTRVRENLHYTKPTTLMRVWPSRFPSVEFAQQYIRNPEKLANYVYCNRLGNGPPTSGDGWRFRGRGYYQLTGRSNYGAFGAEAAIDVLAHPELLEKPEAAMHSACWFWRNAGLAYLADAGDFKSVCRRLNGGLVGYEDGDDEGLNDRVERHERALAVLQVAS